MRQQLLDLHPIPAQPQRPFDSFSELSSAQAWSFCVSLVGGKGSEIPRSIRRRALGKRILYFTIGDPGELTRSDVISLLVLAEPLVCMWLWAGGHRKHRKEQKVTAHHARG